VIEKLYYTYPSMPSNPPTFAVILTTHKRPEFALRAVRSAVEQIGIEPFVVVVNDSPETDYAVLENYVRAVTHIHYIKNSENSGKNYSVNAALDYLAVQNFTGYVVFLDDDDWLDTQCLEQFAHAITKSSRNHGWFISNRVTKNGQILTKNYTNHSSLSYYKDYLIYKRFTGDATHCISFPETLEYHYSKSIKNGEEWFYFSQVAKQFPLFTYVPFTGTWSEGYDPEGLTRSPISFTGKFVLYMKLVCELSSSHLWSISLAGYMTLRLGRILIPK
jgi:glycosyltransferase involved in cell wall biosynthesis